MKQLMALICLVCLFITFGVVSADTTYTVQYGDTLYRIALNHGVSTQEIMQANGITDANRIYAGQVLVIPDGDMQPEPTQPPAPQPTQPPVQPTQPPLPSTGTSHIVQPGDTVARIARRYGVSIQAIVSANGLANPNFIFVGQRLIIPGSSIQPTLQPTQPPVATSTPVPLQPTPSTPPLANDIIYTVQPGDTVARIARRYGVSIQAIVSANGLANPNFIFVGQRLRIPLGATQPTPVLPTATSVPPTPVPVEPTDVVPTSIPSTPTAVLPTATTVPPTSTTIPPTATTVPPTSTTVPPTPTTVLPTATPGPNVLPNYSFEEGHYNLNDIPELQVPTRWRLEWDEGENQFGTTWFRPESRVLSGAFLPAFERPLFIYDGWHTVKIFKGYGPISYRLLSDVNLTPGTYELVVQVFPDMVIDVVNGQKIFATDPRSAEIALLGNGTTSGYLLPAIGQRNIIAHQFRVEEAGVVTVGAGMRGRYGLQSNGFFTDAWSLKRIGD